MTEQRKKTSDVEARDKIRRAYRRRRPSNEGAVTGLSFTIEITPDQAQALQDRKKAIEAQLEA